MKPPNQPGLTGSVVVSSVCASASVFSEDTDKRGSQAKPVLEPLITRQELCAAFHIHHDTARRWEISGKLMPVALSGKTVRYRLADVRRLLSEARCRRKKKPGPKPKAVSSAQPTTTESEEPQT